MKPQKVLIIVLEKREIKHIDLLLWKWTHICTLLHLFTYLKIFQQQCQLL